MNQILYMIVIFLFVAFVYIHVLFHLKVNNSMSIRTIQITGKEDFEEQCDIRLPFTTFYHNAKLNDTFSIANLTKNYNSFRINGVSIGKFSTLFETDSFLSTNNEDFLIESDTINTISAEDNFLRPSFTCCKKYDVCMGKRSTTHFKSVLYFRTYVYVADGSIDVYLCPPKSTRFLNYSYNNETFSNESDMDPFDENIQQGESFDKIKPLRVTLRKGELLFIPSAWYYSYKMDDPVIIVSLQYRSLMNVVTLTPNYINYVYNKMICDKKEVNLCDKKREELLDKKEANVCDKKGEDVLDKNT